MEIHRPLMLPANDAAAFLGLSKSTLLRETRRGKIRAKRIGQRYWYNRATLESYASLEVESSEHTGAEAQGRLGGLRHGS